MCETRKCNSVSNNNSNNNGGMMAMTNNNINSMEVFAASVKAAMETVYGLEYSVTLQEVVKNNGRTLKGLCIGKDDENMAPTIYLDGFFEEYKKGTSMEKIYKEVERIYEDNKTKKDFDVSGIMNYEQMKDRICYKLVNAKRNQKLLADAPHIMFHDLAIIYYILISKDTTGTGTITVKNNFMNMWGVDADDLYSVAKKNMQRLFRGKVLSMTSVITEILSDNMDNIFSEEFFDMAANRDDMMPMYVATNYEKINGAAVVLYDNLLKEFAERIGSDFFILPSSIHEVLFVPAIGGVNARDLVRMVREVNATEVAADEILSDNVYVYNRAADRVEMI
jgi:hypothetical protein